jgi:hypothetical protein
MYCDDVEEVLLSGAVAVVTLLYGTDVVELRESIPPNVEFPEIGALDDDDVSVELLEFFVY